MYENNITQSYGMPPSLLFSLILNNILKLDDLDTALELYFKRMELAELGNVPVPQNSDMPSSENEKILEVSIIRKQKDAISPSSNLRRSNRTLPNSPESTPAKKLKGTAPSSKAPVTKETDIGKSQPNILNPIQPPNIHMLGHFLSERVGRHVTSINPLVEVD